MDLKALLSHRILENILGEVKSPPGEYLVLVLDKSSLKIISSACKMSEILSKNVTLVESLEKCRTPLPYEAVYILEPTLFTIQKFVSDWEGPDYIYKAAHLFFTEACSEDLFQLLQKPNVIKYIKTLKESDTCYHAIESRVYQFSCPNAFFDFYRPEPSSYKNIIEKLSGQLASLCFSLGENPIIRFRQELPRLREFALLTQEKLDKLKQSNPMLGSVGKKQKSKLLILDRGFDTITPVLHHLTLQAMIYDLLTIENDIFTYSFTSNVGVESSKSVSFEESDDLWIQLRHLHIADASKKISSLVTEFISDKKIPKIEGDVSLKNLHEIMKKLPQYRRQLHQFQMHFAIVEEALKVYTQNEYDRVCLLEQSLALGEDENHQKVEDGMRLMVPILLDDKLTAEIKARIVSIYIMQCKTGVQKDRFARLVQHGNITGELRPTLLNLQHLGVSIIQGQGSPSKYHFKRIDRDPEKYYKQSRWVPLLQDILENLIDEKLDSNYCSFTKPGSNKVNSVSTSDSVSSVSAESKRGWKWRRDGTQPQHGASNTGEVVRHVTTGEKSTIIVFIIGGLTYAEIRVVYEMMNRSINKFYSDNFEIIIGSTDLITPAKFFTLIRELPSVYT